METLNKSPFLFKGKNMIQYIKGDITQETSGVILHSVNCQGVMGSGVALAIRNKWPEVYNAYKEMPAGRISLGEVQYIHIDSNLIIANLWGQEFFGNDGKRYADPIAIQYGLTEAIKFCYMNNLELKMPKIGALRGGLSWEDDIVPILDFLLMKYKGVTVKIIDIV